MATTTYNTHHTQHIICTYRPDNQVHLNLFYFELTVLHRTHTIIADAHAHYIYTSNANLLRARVTITIKTIRENQHANICTDKCVRVDLAGSDVG